MTSLHAALRIVFDSVNRVYQTGLMLPPQASTLARRIDALQYFEITIYTLIAIAYFGAAVWFLLRYRRRSPDQVGEPVRAPLLTTVVGGSMFALFTVFWIAGDLQFRQIHTPPAGALEVYVTAKQWMWKFDYANGTGSVGVLYVPAGRPVRLLLTSRDVIHSFFVPAFRLKQDAVPGTYTSLWFTATTPGRYQILCSQMCGPGHPRMLGEVAVLPNDEYEAWLRGDTFPGEDAIAAAAGGSRTAGAPASIVDLGRRDAATYGCLKCHSIDGERHIGPTWLGLFGSMQPLMDGSSIRADEAYLTESMMDPAAKIVRGFAPVMPSYQGLLQPADTAAIVEFIKSLRNPNTPHVMTPPPAGPIPGVTSAPPGITSAPSSGDHR